MSPLPTSRPSSSAESHGGPESAYATFDHALEAISVKGAPGIEVIGALKGVWGEVCKQAAETNRAEGGRATGKFLCEWVDRVLGRVLKFAIKRATADGTVKLPRIAILALGSYGRVEMAPYSDWDMLILHQDTTNKDELKQLESLVGLMLRLLWDANLTLGHSVRTPEDCLRMMEEGVHGEQALETATSLLEARFVVGDEELANGFLKRDLTKFFKERGRPFVEAKLEEALRRYRRQGVSVYHTQPNLKDHPGAMRDFQLSIWIDRASQLSGHLPRLAKRPLVSKDAIQEAAEGYERLLTLRTAMHSACGRKQDILDHRLQQSLAEALGYEATDELHAGELLLRDYFGAAVAIHRLADVVIRRYQEEQALASYDIEKLRRRPVDPNYTRIGDLLYAARPGLYDGSDWLVMAFQAFLVATRLGIDISQEIREGIRARIPGLEEQTRRDPRAAKVFLELLRHRTNVARSLRSMRDVGLLGAYFPEFGELQDLVVQDVFHDFTVDEHTLFVVENIDRLYLSGDPSERVRRQVLERLARPEILRLAGLFHDLGKSRGGAGHSRRGALMIPQLAARLGLHEAWTRALIFLVENHLLLSEASLQRDPGEGQFLKRLSETIGSQDRLDLLYLLTCADIAAVGQGAFPKWKEELLRDLYVRLSERLDPERPADESGEREGTGRLEASVFARAKDEAQRIVTREHFARVPPRYLVEVDEDEAAFHLELLRALRERKQSSVAASRGEGPLVDVWVVSTNRANRFHRICGAFLGMGVSIVSAIAYTRDDGIIFDRFQVSLGTDAATASRQADSDFWKRVAVEVERTLEGRVDSREKIEAARRRIPRTPTVTRQVEPEVRFDNKLSDSHSVVDVVCGDRIGLLYGLSRALADLGCEIHFSKVDTNQGRATDVFYITERNGGKILDPEKAHNIRLLLRAVAADFQSARR